MKRFIFILLLSAWLSPALAEAARVDEGSTMPPAWMPQSEWGSKAKLIKGPKDREAVTLGYDFENMRGDWVVWDRRLVLDLSQARQVQFEVKTDRPQAISRALLYLMSGEGSYVLPAFGFTKDWSSRIFQRDSAQLEGQPEGWHSITGLRLAVMPAEGVKGSIEITTLRWLKDWDPDQLGQIGPYQYWAQAREDIWSKALGTIVEDEVQVSLDTAGVYYQAALAAESKSDDAVQKAIVDGRSHVARAWSLVQPQVQRELHGAWIFRGDGVGGSGAARSQRWFKAVPQMAGLGINTIFPAMAFAGVAFYKSAALPVYSGVELEGDYLQEVILAAKGNSVQVHAMKVMWQLSEGLYAPLHVAEAFRADNRLAVDSQGHDLPWLCPCNPANQALELASIREMAAYDVDGIHLATLQFPGQDFSFSPACKVGFEKESGHAVVNWPADVMADGEQFELFANYRRKVLSDFLVDVRRVLEETRPGLTLSAAVMASPWIAGEGLYQDWPVWIDHGLVDFVVPINDTEDPSGFDSQLRAQRAAVGTQAGVKIIPGLAATFDEGRSLPLENAVAQMIALRHQGQGGWVFAEWRDYLASGIMPALAAGPMRKGSKLPVEKSRSAIEIQAGERMSLPGEGFMLDDFEDGNLTHAMGGHWRALVDQGNLGSRIEPNPLQPTAEDRKNSEFALHVSGIAGTRRAPWPLAMVESILDPGQQVRDLSTARALAFVARGDGKDWEVLLIQPELGNGAWLSQRFTPAEKWQDFRLEFKKFKRPEGSPEIVPGVRGISAIRFQPVDRDHEEFDLWLDDVEFKK